MIERLVPRQIAWRQHYHVHRYARHLSQQELDRRIRDIILNMLHLNPEAKIGLGRLTDESASWIEKWTHMLEEMQLRHGPYPKGFTPEILHSEPFPDFASKLAEKAAKRMSSLGLEPGDVFIKFGKRQYMERLYESGELRIQPATVFARTDHNGAVRDDELTRDVSFALSREDILKLVRNPQDVPGNIREHRCDIQFRFPTDYWLYCVTNSVEPRLFVDFSADACVVIRDREGFRDKLRDATRDPLHQTMMCDGPAVYVDPLLPRSTRMFLPFTKHFAYTYQDEYRFGWLPKISTQRLTHLDIAIGSLSDCADLIVL